MNNPADTLAALAALAEEVDSADDRFVNERKLAKWADQIRTLAAALASLKGEAEPVAYMIHYPDGDKRADLSPETCSVGATVRPLIYGDTTPPAQQPGEVVTDEMVEAAAEAIHAMQRKDGTVNDWNWADLSERYKDEYRRMARAALAPKEKGNAD